MTVKRLLSIDGGGIRGIIAAEILAHMEDQLKARNPKLQRLSDYFDFISGTSTGAIIATGLAIGMSAHDILHIYKTKGKRIFAPAQHNIDELLDSFGIKGKKKWAIANFLILPNGLWHIFKNKIFQTLLTKYSGKELEEELQRNVM